MDVSTWAIWDTCMGFPGFTRSACASWVQAWGSIAAILVAVHVAGRSDREAKRHAISSARTFAALVSGSMEGALEAMQKGNRLDLSLRAATIEVARNHGERVNIEQLPLPSIAAVSALQALAVQAVQAVRFHELQTRGMGGAVSGSQATEALKHCVSEAERHCQVLQAKHVFE